MKTYVICSALIKKRGKFLIGKRSQHKKFAPGQWELISGFIDKERKSAEEIMFDELREELNISGKIAKRGLPFAKADREGRWIILPFVIETDAKGLRINEEDHSELRWVTKKELSTYKDLKTWLKDLKRLGML